MTALLCAVRGGRACAGAEPVGRKGEEFLRRFMRLEHGAPGRGAFSALFRSIDPGGLQRALVRLAADRAGRAAASH